MNGWICDCCKQSQLDVPPHGGRLWPRLPEGWISGGLPTLRWVACSVECAEYLRNAEPAVPDDRPIYAVVEDLRQERDAARKERDEVRRELETQEGRADFWKAENRSCEDILVKAGAMEWNGDVAEGVAKLVRDLAEERSEKLQRAYDIEQMSALRKEQSRSDPQAQASVIERYQRCVYKILDMFPGDPLPKADEAHFLIERLESILRLGLIGPRGAGR